MDMLHKIIWLQTNRALAHWACVCISGQAVVQMALLQMALLPPFVQLLTAQAALQLCKQMVLQIKPVKQALQRPAKGPSIAQLPTASVHAQGFKHNACP